MRVYVYRIKVVLPVPFWPSMTMISESQKSPGWIVSLKGDRSCEQTHTVRYIMS